VDEFLARRGPSLTTEQAGQAIADLAAARDEGAGAYLLSADGLRALS
jgi:hypothetical protein